MSQSYRLKISRPSLKLKVATRIPVQLVGGTGVTLTKANGTYTFDLNFDELGTIAAYTDGLEATTYLPSWESTGDDFSKISITNLKADLTASFDLQYQPLDAELTAIAGLTSAANKLPYFTGAGTASLTDFSSFARTLVDDADQAAMRVTLGLTPGTDVQAYDADLAALAANSTDGLWAHTGSGTGAARTLTAPAAGMTITNPAGIAGNPTFVLANDLAAVEGLASTGIARRTGSDAWSVGTAVANSELATMAAYTIKGNATGSSAVPTDISIPALTQKASPVAGDYVMIADSADSNSLKYSLVSALAAAGAVGSYNGRTGTVSAIGTDVPLRSYLAGLTLSTAGSSATFGIAAGVATDSTNVSMMALASAYTKTTSSWAVGTGNGALDTGSIANSTWYHVYQIQRPDTGVVDVLISLSATSPTLPANYTLFRRIGSMKTNGSAQWTSFSQVGDKFIWNAAIADINAASNVGTTRASITLTVPTGIVVTALFNSTIVSSGTANSLVYSSLLESSQAPATGYVSIYISGAGSNAGSFQTTTNTSAQIGVRSDGASGAYSVATHGWIDSRGRLD